MERSNSRPKSVRPTHLLPSHVPKSGGYISFTHVREPSVERPSTSGGIPRQSHLPRSKSAGKRVANQQPLVPMSDTSTKEVFAEIDALMDRIRGSTAPPGGAPPIKRTEHGISAYQDPRSKLTPWKPLGFPTRDVGPIAGGSVAVGSGASTSLDFAATAPPSMLSSRGEGAPMPSALAEKSSRPLAVYQNRLPHSLGLSVAPVISPPKHGSHEAPSVGEAAGSTDPSHGEAAGSMLPSVTASAVLTYKHGSASKRSPHHMNEDRAIVVEDVGQVAGMYSSVRTGLIMMCDGHGGSRCVENVIRVFPKQLAEQLRPVFNEDLSPAVLCDQLIHAFDEYDRKWLAIAKKSGGDSSGACMTTILIRGHTLMVANIGDCKAVLKHSNGSLDVLTTDHRCALPSERARIMKAGGFIENGRVLGVLEPTRTIGDLDEKSRPGVVIPTPDVRSVTITTPTTGKSVHVGVSGPKLGSLAGPPKHAPSSTTLVGKGKLAPTEIVVLVVATDGVWDVLPPASVVALATQTIQLTRDPHQAALSIIRAAANHGSVDDITAIVVWFQ